MRQIGIRELKNQATEILRTVREQKVEYVVTHRGVPVARLSPLATESENLWTDEAASKSKTREELAKEIEQILDEKRELPAQNRLALEVMYEWLSEPDEDDDAWWKEFDAQLERNRFNLRHTVYPD